MPKRSGLVQQDPADASFLAGEIAQAAVPLATDLRDLLGPGLLEQVPEDPTIAAAKAGGLDDGVAVAQAPIDDRPAHIAGLSDAIHVTGRNRALADQIRDLLVRGGSDGDDPASPTFTAGVMRRVAEVQQADRDDRPAGLSDAALLSRERHDAAMRASAEVQARALQERVVMDRAFDELELSAESLVQAARAGDDLALLFEELDSLHDRFVDGLDEEPLAEFVANTRRELIEANVLGLARRGDIDAAENVLAAHRSDLPDGQVAFLEQGVGDARQAQTRAGKRQAMTAVLDLNRRAVNGETVAWQAERVAEAGLISPAERRRIERFERDAKERLEREADLVDQARDAVAGGAALDPSNREHRLAAELWYRDEGEALFAGLEPEARIGAVALAVSRLGHVPTDLHRDLVLDLRSADPAVALQASRQIAALQEAAPAMAGAAFSDGELARAGTVIALDAHGTDTLIPDANALAPVDEPDIGLVGEAMDANTGLLVLRDAFAELRRVHGGEGAWKVGDDGRFHLIDSTTGEPVLDDNGSPVSVGEAQVFLIADQIARARRGGTATAGDGVQVATIRPGEDDEVLGFEVAFDRFGRPLGGGAGAGGSGASGADVLNGLLRWLVGQEGVQNVEQHLEDSASEGESSAVDDAPFVPQLSIAGLGPEEMADLSRAIDEAAVRAEHDRRLVEVYRDPGLLRDTFAALRQVYGGEGNWVVGDDRRVHLTDAATGAPILDEEGQPISVDETQVLFAASAVARHRADTLVAAGDEVHVASSLEIVSPNTPLLESSLNRASLDGLDETPWDGDDFAPIPLGIALGVLLGLAGTSIIEGEGTDTPEGGQGGEGDGPDEEEDESKDTEGGAVAAQGQPGGPQPVDPPPGGEVTDEDRARAERIADGTSDLIDQIIELGPPDFSPLAIEYLNRAGNANPDREDIGKELIDLGLFDIEYRLGVDGQSFRGGPSTPHTEPEPTERYEAARALALELFPWLRGLRDAGYFEDKTGSVALGDIPAQPDNVRENILRGLAAIDALLSHSGPGQDTVISNAMYRADLAEQTFKIDRVEVTPSTSIDFLWGDQFPREDEHDNPYGIEHLIAKHGIEELVHMVNTIANGEIRELKIDAGGKGSVNLVIRHEGRLVVLSLKDRKSGQASTWVLTAYEVTGTDANEPTFNISRLNRSTLLFRQETTSF